MPPHIIIPRPRVSHVWPRCTSQARPRLPRALARSYSSSRDDPPPRPVGHNLEVLPNAKWGAAATADIPESGLEMEQRTSIGEISKHDPEAQENTPKVSGNTTPTTEQEQEDHSTGIASTATFSAIPPNITPPLAPGAKFPVPQLPLPSCSHLKHRYSTIIDQVTNFIMVDGRKAKAQSLMTEILSNLRTRPAPKPRPGTPLLPGTPELSTLPLGPVQYLQTAIDSLSPLVKISMHKAGGGTKKPVPYPLKLRQRRRFALTWIRDAADKKKEKLGFAERFAEEVVAVVEGRSSAWEKRSMIHKLAVASRANVVVNPGRSVAPSKIKFPAAVI